MEQTAPPLSPPCLVATSSTGAACNHGWGAAHPALCEPSLVHHSHTPALKCHKFQSLGAYLCVLAAV